MKAAQYTPLSPEEKVDGISVLLPLQARDGFAFLLAKTAKTTGDAEDLFHLLSDQIHRLTESFGSEANAQQRFEHFLGALNETLAQSVREGRWRVSINQFDAVVGIACEQQMFLSGTGDLYALFLHKRSEQRYQIFNLSRSIHTEQSLPTWEKPFAVILDGDLHDGDVFVLSNQDLQRAIPSEDLHSILTTLPPSGATEKIRRYFPERCSVHLQIIKISLATQFKYLQESKATLKTDVSINRFKEQEDATQALLDDQTPKISSIVQVVRKKVITILQKRIWKILWILIRRMMRNTAKGALHFKTKEGRIEAKNYLLTTVKTTGKRTKVLIHKIRRVPKSTRYLLAGVVAVALVLMVSVSFLSSARAKSEEANAYQEQIVKIEDLMERATGALIYKDENQARGLFLNADTVISQLPSDTPERVQKILDLKQSIQKSTDEIRHMVTVPNPALLGDLASLIDGVFGQAFTKVGAELYVFASDGRVYQLDRTQKVFKPASAQVDGARIATAVSEEEGRVFALMTDQSLVEFAKDENAQKSVNIEKPAGTFIDLMAYANRLYILTVSDTDGNVWRFDKAGSAFLGGSPWISSKIITLEDARALTIDGTIFVLKKNGNIARFVNGSEVEFKTGVVDPPITNATDLWTDIKSNYLYVLESDTKRVIVFNKDTGNFVVQYRSESFQSASDMVVDESAYAIYLLSGSKLYSIAPSHITR